MTRSCCPPLTSQSLTVPSLDPERTFRPRATIAVEVILRVCSRRMRAGVTRAVYLVASSGGGSGGGAGGGVGREKYAPARSRTREDGKNCRDVTELRCGLEDFWAMTERSGLVDTG